MTSEDLTAPTPLPPLTEELVLTLWSRTYISAPRQVICLGSLRSITTEKPAAS